MKSTIQNHLLEGVPYVPSPNRSGKFTKGLPDTLILHYTAGPSLESAKNTFLNSSAKASAHILIDRDGSVLQMVPFDTIAWHAGESKWGKRKGLNNYSIGIELVNAGKLTKEKGGYVAWFGTKYAAKDILKAVHRNETEASYWQKYTDKQLAACEKLVALLIKEYRISTLLGHEEISPGRKVDPGPAFPLDEMRAKLLGKPTGPDMGIVTASALNIRKGPGATEEKIAEALPNGHEMEILETQGGWTKVRTTAVVEGWVSSKYVQVK